jgi:ubiquinol-cytochrome c reductase iron-sulfur subunit
MSEQDPKPVRGFAKLVAFLIAARTARRAAAGREPPPDGGPEAHPDVDPSERIVPSSRRAETLVAALLFIAAILAFGFTAIYVVAGSNTQLLGLSLGLALAFLAAALIVAGKFVVPQETHVEPRGPLLVEEQAEEVATMIEEGGEGISRRVLLTGAGGVAGAALVTAAATPLASLGPNLKQIHTTPWKRGVRLIDDQARPYAADEIQIGTFYTALPEHEDPEQFGAGLVVVRLPAEQIHLPAARHDWAPDGILAYSKICPHAGCAIALYRYPTYEPTSAGPAFTCPCHYSTFLPGEGGRLIFGPAGRALPQLPLMIDAAGYLRAAGPFHEDVGPSWWNVHRSES